MSNGQGVTLFWERPTLLFVIKQLYLQLYQFFERNIQQNAKRGKGDPPPSPSKLFNMVECMSEKCKLVNFLDIENLNFSQIEKRAVKPVSLWADPTEYPIPSIQVEKSDLGVMWRKPFFLKVGGI